MASGGVRAGVAYAEIVPKLTEGFSNDLEKQFSKPVEESGNKVGASLGKVAGLIGGAFAAKGIFDFGKAAVEAATESAKITAQTENVIRSTGNAAKVTAGQIGDLAASISAKTGVDDEAIQEGQNLLLTFTNIRNEAGKGNDVFNQSTQTLVDMAAAMGTDVKGGAIQLGKALNDPVKGISALSRVGVTFTDQQKEQIKAMVAVGNTAGAQKVILAELNKEFGGSAAAQATAGDKLKVVMGNLQEEIGGKLLPVFEKFATFAAEFLPQAFDAGSRAFDRIRTAAQPVIEFIQNAIKQFGNAWEVIKSGDDVAAGLGEVFDNILGNTGNLIPVITSLVEWFQRTWSFVQDNLKPILIGLGVTIGALVSPIGLAIGAVVYAYTQFDTFRNVVNTVVEFLKNTVAPAVAEFAGYVIGQFQNLISWVQQYWPQISEAITHVLNVIETVVRTTIDILTALWRQWGDDILRLVQTAWDYIRGTIDNALQVIRGIIATVTALINGDWGKAWDGFKQILAGIWDQITNVFRTAVDGIKSLMGGLASTLGELFKGAADKIVDFLLSIPGRIANLGKDILSKLIPDVPGGGVLKSVLGKIPGFARGGIVPGPIGMPQLAVVHGGETVNAVGQTSAAGPLVGEMNFYGAKATPAEFSREIAWQRRFSGR